MHALTFSQSSKASSTILRQKERKCRTENIFFRSAFVKSCKYIHSIGHRINSQYNKLVVRKEHHNLVAYGMKGKITTNGTKYSQRSQIIRA